jgi:hypothetical protein
MIQRPFIPLTDSFQQTYRLTAFALACYLLMVISGSLLTFAATPTDEGLYHELEKVKASKTITPPFPFEQKDQLQETTGRVSQSAQRAYALFWKRMMPLLNHLASVETVMNEGLTKQKSLNLQWFSSQVLWARLLHQQLAGVLKPEDVTYKTYQLMEQAVANLDDALAFWQANESIGATFRPTAVNINEEAVYLDAKLRVASESLTELKQLTVLYWLLEKGYKQGDR